MQYRIPCGRGEEKDGYICGCICKLCAKRLCPTCRIVKELVEACREVAEYEGICDDDDVPSDLREKCKAALAKVMITPPAES